MSSRWPPESFEPAHEAIARYEAWWTGDIGALRAAYAPKGGHRLGEFNENYFSLPVPPGDADSAVHIPLAADICRTSADLLFNKPPRIEYADAATQGFIDAQVDDGLMTRLREAAETCAALGWVFLVVCWDEEYGEAPFISVAQPDSAYPEFTRNGRLRAVTFARVIEADGDRVVRHLERHERGAIRHAVYVGSADELGYLDELGAYADTAPLVAQLDDGDAIYTGTDYLTAAIVPNIRPAKQWRADPVLKDLGQSDLADVENLMGRLDQAWSDWMTELRLGKKRLLVDQSVLENLGKGQGAFFDVDRELFTPLNIGLSDAEKAVDPIREFSPELRVSSFKATADALFRAVIDHAGYSGQTFGLEQGIAQTAAEIEAREQKTLVTRSKKVTYWTAGLKDITAALVGVASGRFGLPLAQGKPTVTFPAWVEPSMQELGQAASMFRGAQVMSLITTVKFIHPDWDETQILDEVAAIEAEQRGEALIPVDSPAEVEPEAEAEEEDENGEDLEEAA